MRRLLSPSVIDTFRGGGARLSPYLLPPPLFLGFSHSQSRLRWSSCACRLEVV
jgi:hypothetical protein